MTHARFTLAISVEKPIPQALRDALPAIREKIQQLKQYALVINAGKVNEEDTQRAEEGETGTHATYQLDLAVPWPLPAALKTALPAIKERLRQLKQYADRREDVGFHCHWHICHHEDGLTCGEEQEI